MKDSTVKGRDFIGKVIVSDETGKRFGRVGDVSFLPDSGELMNLLLVEATRSAAEMQLQQDEKGRFLVPFSSVKSVGDFVIIAEKDVF